MLLIREKFLFITTNFPYILDKTRKFRGLSPSATHKHTQFVLCHQGHSVSNFQKIPPPHKIENMPLFPCFLIKNFNYFPNLELMTNEFKPEKACVSEVKTVLFMTYQA